MSLQINLSAGKTGTCKSLYVFETTGSYSSPNFTGGYGTPNLDINDASVTLFRITDTAGVEFTISSVTSPSSNPLVPLVEILNTDIGLTADDFIPDGIYTIRYDVHDDGVPTVQNNAVYTITKKILVTCAIECCLNDKLSKLSVPDCDCEFTDIENLDIAFILLNAAQKAMDCEEYDTALKNLTYVQRFCNFEECKSCK